MPGAESQAIAKDLVRVGHLSKNASDKRNKRRLMLGEGNIVAEERMDKVSDAV
ncbi:unnamed protein product [Rhizopus microsporus]